MTGLISVEDALSLILANRPQPDTLSVPLDAALGHVLAEPMIAKLTQPPLAVSAMDGYAIRLDDVSSGGAALRVIGESPAGRPFTGRMGPGEAVRIFTGGAIPEGADRVVIQEDVERNGTIVRVPRQDAGPSHIRAAGIDFSAGDTLVAAGTRLGPAHLAAAAAANHATLPVRRPPRIALLANGDELKAPGTDLAPGEIIASSRYGLAGLVSEWGGEALDLGIAQDSVSAIQARIRTAADADVIVPVGGASVGDHDHMRRAFDELGAQTLFAKVRVRPGKPTWFAAMGQQIVLGLPGNPASALVCAHLFLRPLITGAPTPQVKATLLANCPANGGRDSFLRALCHVSDGGQLLVEPAANQDSALIHPFLTANALVRRPAHTEATPAGSLVDVQLIGPL